MKELLGYGNVAEPIPLLSVTKFPFAVAVPLPLGFTTSIVTEKGVFAAPPYTLNVRVAVLPRFMIPEDGEINRVYWGGAATFEISKGTRDARTRRPIIRKRNA